MPLKRIKPPDMSIKPSRIEAVFSRNRSRGKKGFIAFVNAGDPDLRTTRQIIRVLEYNAVDIVELCVPFPNSFTDGELILKSHDRALQQNITLNDVLELVSQLRKESSIPLVLLADYSHTVKSLGLEPFLFECGNAGVDGTLIHGLPPLLSKKYHIISNAAGLNPILGIYPVTSTLKRQEVYDAACGYLYLAARYGKSGGVPAADSKHLQHYIEQVRLETSIPLAVGLGVQGRADLEYLYGTGIDAVVVGSILVSIIERNIGSQKAILRELNLFMQNLYFDYWFNC